MPDPITVLRAIRALWARYGRVILALASLHAIMTAALRLPRAAESLLIVSGGPIDLLIRMDEIRRWFDGIAIYRDAGSSNYPPASYTLLWPLVGWLQEQGGRALFALSLVASVGVIGFVAVRVSHATGLAAKTLMAVLVLPLGATQITVWIGQLGLHVVACLLAAGLLLFGSRRTGMPEAGTRFRPSSAGWLSDSLASLLLAVSLVKPTLSVPVVAAILLLARRWRPTFLTSGIYLGMTVLAAAFQEANPFELVGMWLGRESVMNLPLGSVNTYLWLHWLGVEGSMLWASAAWLVGLAVVTWRYRRVDPWLLIGVAALVGRLWIHHRAFDDVLLVIPAIVLFRIAAGGREGRGGAPVVAGFLLAAVYGFGHAPYAWLSGGAPAAWLLTEVGRTVIWAFALGFLLWWIGRTASFEGGKEGQA